MRDTPFDRILKELSEVVQDKTIALASGACRSYDEYKEMCGELRGLSRAVTLLDDLKRKLEQE